MRLVRSDCHYVARWLNLEGRNMTGRHVVGDDNWWCSVWPKFNPKVTQIMVILIPFVLWLSRTKWKECTNWENLFNSNRLSYPKAPEDPDNCLPITHDSLRLVDQVKTIAEQRIYLDEANELYTLLTAKCQYLAISHFLEYLFTLSLM